MKDTTPLRRVFGPYECYTLLGINSNSTVYLARHRETNEEVALRVMQVDTSKDIPGDDNVDNVTRCKRTLQAIKELDSTNLVPVADYGSVGTVLYIAMPRLKGGSLMQRLQAYKGAGVALPSPGQTTALVSAIAAALDRIHNQGWVHGQILPENIMFNAAGEPHLADVGLTRLFKLVFALNSTGSFTTGIYTPPEQWQGGRPTAASDQYALAAIAYELFTGQPPFTGNSIYQLMTQHANDTPEPLHRLREGLPGQLSMLFFRALSKTPDERFETVGAFAQVVSKSLDGYEGEDSPFFTFELT